MKIGISTCLLDKGGFGRYDDKAYEKLRALGYSCTDLDMANTESVLYTAPRAEAEAFLLHERELAEKAGIKINQVHGPWRWPPNDTTEENRRERMEKMKESIRLTALLGCENWVIHPIMPYGIEEAGTENAQKTWELNLTFMREILKTAKEYGVTICFENMPMLKFSLAKPEDILRFVREINDENFKICLDTGHVAVFKELDIGEEVRRLGKEIRVLHVHDNRYSRDMHLMPFFGVIDWKSFAKALKDIDFKGSFSLETVPPKQLPDPLFEEMAKCLFDLASEITDGI